MSSREKYEPSMMELVYAQLADNPASTCQELAVISGLSVIQTGKRITELVAQGRAVPVEKRACRITGRWMTSWRRVA